MGDRWTEPLSESQPCWTQNDEDSPKRSPSHPLARVSHRPSPVSHRPSPVSHRPSPVSHPPPRYARRATTPLG